MDERRRLIAERPVWRDPLFLGHVAAVLLALALFALAASLVDAPVDDATLIVLAVFALGFPWSFFAWMAAIGIGPIVGGILLGVAAVMNLGVHAIVYRVRTNDARESAASAARWDL